MSSISISSRDSVDSTIREEDDVGSLGMDLVEETASKTEIALEPVLGELMAAIAKRDPVEAEKCVKALRNEHHFTKEDIKPELKKALAKQPALSAEDRKVVAKEFSKIYNDSYGEYSMKKTSIKTWLLAGALFTLGVLFVAVGIAGIPWTGGGSLLLGLAGGALCFGVGVTVIGIDWKKRAEPNLAREQANVQVKNNVHLLSKAHEKAEELQERITAHPDHADADKWQTELNGITNDIKKFAKANTLTEESKKENKANREALSKDRERNTDNIRKLSDRLDVLEEKMSGADATGTPVSPAASSISVSGATSSAGAPPPVPQKNLHTLRSEINRRINQMDTNSDGTFKDYDNDALAEAYLNLSQSTTFLKNDDITKVFDHYGSQKGLLDAIENSQKNINFNPDVLDCSIHEGFEEWFEALKLAIPADKKPVQSEISKEILAEIEKALFRNESVSVPYSGHGTIVPRVPLTVDQKALHSAFMHCKERLPQMTPETLRDVLANFGGSQKRFIDELAEAVRHEASNKKQTEKPLLTFIDTNVTEAASSSGPVERITNPSQHERVQNAKGILKNTSLENYLELGKTEIVIISTKPIVQLEQSVLVSEALKFANLEPRDIKHFSNEEKLKLQQLAKSLQSAIGRISTSNRAYVKLTPFFHELLTTHLTEKKSPKASFVTPIDNGDVKVVHPVSVAESSSGPVERTIVSRLNTILIDKMPNISTVPVRPHPHEQEKYKNNLSEAEYAITRYEPDFYHDILNSLRWKDITDEQYDRLLGKFNGEENFVQLLDERVKKGGKIRYEVTQLKSNANFSSWLDNLHTELNRTQDDIAESSIEKVKSTPQQPKKRNVLGRFVNSITGKKRK